MSRTPVFSIFRTPKCRKAETTFLALAPPGYALVHVTALHKTAALIPLGFTNTRARPPVLSTPEVPMCEMPKWQFPGFLSPFGISGFQMPKCIGPLVLRIPDPPNPDFPILPGLSTFSRFRNFRSRNARVSYLQDSRNVESRNAEMALLSGFSLNSWISATRPPMMDGPQSFHDFAKSNAEMLRHPVLLIPEVPTCEMSMDSRSPPRVPTDGRSRSVRGFHPGDSRSPVLETF
jgi:hypothetical protein